MRVAYCCSHPNRHTQIYTHTHTLTHLPLLTESNGSNCSVCNISPLSGYPSVNLMLCNRWPFLLLWQMCLQDCVCVSLKLHVCVCMSLCRCFESILKMGPLKTIFLAGCIWKPHTSYCPCLWVYCASKCVFLLFAQMSLKWQATSRLHWRKWPQAHNTHTR